MKMDNQILDEQIEPPKKDRLSRKSVFIIYMLWVLGVTGLSLFLPLFFFGGLPILLHFILLCAAIGFAVFVGERWVESFNKE